MILNGGTEIRACSGIFIVRSSGRASTTVSPTPNKTVARFTCANSDWIGWVRDPNSSITTSCSTMKSCSVAFRMSESRRCRVGSLPRTTKTSVYSVIATTCSAIGSNMAHRIRTAMALGMTNSCHAGGRVPPPARARDYLLAPAVTRCSAPCCNPA